MKVGDLVMLKHSTSTSVGLITHIKDCPRDDRDTLWHTVRWQNGYTNETYESDELEVLSASR